MCRLLIPSQTSTAAPLNYGNELKNLLHLDVVDRYMRRIGDKRFHTRLRRDWNCFIPHESQVSIYRNQGLVETLSCSPIKITFYPKSTAIPGCCCLSHHSHPNEEAARSCRCPYGDAKYGYLGCKIVYAIHRNSSPTNIKIYQTQLFRCWSTISRCHGFFITFVSMLINRD